MHSNDFGPITYSLMYQLFKNLLFAALNNAIAPVAVLIIGRARCGRASSRVTAHGRLPPRAVVTPIGVPVADLSRKKENKKESKKKRKEVRQNAYYSVAFVE